MEGSQRTLVQRAGARGRKGPPSSLGCEVLSAQLRPPGAKQCLSHRASSLFLSIPLGPTEAAASPREAKTLGSLSVL